jgi:alpha-tubulin suppressor-like RCC1 family protein
LDTERNPAATQVLTSASLRAISVGWTHTCGLTDDNRAICWGDRGFGTLGDGYLAFAPNPVVVQSSQAWKQVSSGYSHRCAIDAGAIAYCWGWRGIGDGTFQIRSTPVPVQGGLAFHQLAATSGFTCGVATDGRGYCWGQNNGGSLGIGWSDSDGGAYATPQAMAGGKTFASMAPGVCALDTEGTAYCWGHNIRGRLGTGSFSGPESCPQGPCSTAPVAVAGDLRFTTIGGRNQNMHHCAVGADGVAYCWGSNGSGQLGDGTKSDRAAPVAVTGGQLFSNISVGGGHSCGLTAEGKAYCWGNDGWGQLGLGTYRGDFTSPVPVETDLTFAAIATSFAATCGLTASGDVYCWGANQGGLLGVGTLDGPSYCSGVPCSRTPLLVGGGYASVSAGAYSTCATRPSGAAECWGRRSRGELGDGILGYEHTPVFSATSIRFGSSGWPNLVADGGRGSRLHLGLPVLRDLHRGAASGTWRPSERIVLRTWETGSGSPLRYKSGKDAFEEAMPELLGIRR